jgi:hypothetical protein
MKQGLKKPRYKGVCVEDIDVKKFYTKIKPSSNQFFFFLDNFCFNKMQYITPMKPSWEMDFEVNVTDAIKQMIFKLNYFLKLIIVFDKWLYL